LRICYKPYIAILHIHSKTSKVYKIHWNLRNKLGEQDHLEQDYLECEYEVEPFYNIHGKIQNMLSEYGIKQPYKLTSKDELWTSMWPLNFVGTCLYPTFAKYVHVFIKKNVFLCDLMVVINVCQGDLCKMYCELYYTPFLGLQVVVWV
jgi:hypothetical protein